MIRSAISSLRSKFAKLVLYHIDARIINELTYIYPATSSEIEEFLRVCLSLIHTPLDFSGLIHAESAMRTLVQKILENSDAINKYSIILADDILCSFFEDLSWVPNQKTLSRTIHVTVHPEFGFFVTAAGGKKSATPLYIAFCIRFQIAIERISGWKIEGSTKEDYIRACRYFFEYMPDDIKFDPTLPARKFTKADIQLLIKAAINAYKAKNKAKSSKNQEVILEK